MKYRSRDDVLYIIRFKFSKICGQKLHDITILFLPGYSWHVLGYDLDPTQGLGMTLVCVSSRWRIVCVSSRWRLVCVSFRCRIVCVSNEVSPG